MTAEQREAARLAELGRARKQLRRAVLPGLGAAETDHRQLMLDYPQHEVREALGLTSHSPEVVLAAEAIAESTVAEVEAFARRVFHAPQDFRIRVRMDWHLRRRRSRGGRYEAGWRDELLDNGDEREPWRERGGAISLKGYSIARGVTDPEGYNGHGWGEYDILRLDDGTCAMPEAHHRDCAVLEVLHEASHAIQYSFWARERPEAYWSALARTASIVTTPQTDVPWWKAHSTLFQTIYGRIRREWGYLREETDRGAPIGACRQCDALIYPRDPKASRRGRKRVFCSDSCRVTWNNLERRRKGQKR